MDPDHHGRTPPVMALSNNRSLEGLLAEGIDKIMPLALQLTLGKNEEPTFKNILHVVASCCHQRYVSMTETGTFVGLSTGRHFVRKMNTEITNQLTMDDAIFHSLRSLTALQPTVSIQDLSIYVTAAFSFPESLGADQVYDKVHCSVESMKVWGKVLLEDGKYKLPLGDGVTGDLPNGIEVKTISNTKDVHESVDQHALIDGVNKVPAEAYVAEAVGALLIPAKSSILTITPCSHVPSSTKHKRNDESFFRRVHGNASAVGTDPPSGSRGSSGAIKRHRVKSPKAPRRNQYCSVFITVEDSRKKVHGSLAVIRSLFLKTQLNFGTITLGRGLKPFAFVEMRNVEDGNMAVNSLDGRMVEGGAFQLVVEWAKSSRARGL